MVFDRFKRRHDLEKYNIHFHGLRHTFSNMLFEMNENPKVIQQLLGHRDVKTTITTYNSVDKSYFNKATDVINNQYNNKNTDKNNDIKQEIDEDELEEYLQWKKEREKKKKQKDFEM